MRRFTRRIGRQFEVHRRERNRGRARSCVLALRCCPGPESRSPLATPPSERSAHGATYGGLARCPSGDRARPTRQLFRSTYALAQSDQRAVQLFQ
jgi:hypothetical protein